MTGGKIICILLFSLSWVSCVEALTQFNDKYKPKEKYKYYTPDFVLPTKNLLRTDGYYIDAEDHVQPIFISLKEYEKNRGKHRMVSGNHDLDSKPPKKDTTVYTSYIFAAVFCNNGIFKYMNFNSVSRDSIDQYMNTYHQEICTLADGKDFFRIKENNTLDTESYNWYSGFFYSKALITKDTLYYGSYNRYKDGKSGQIFIPFKIN